tara:strand:+ start:299 stop:595 length:297 start_codon:yes stop_codon:yes gene_type:complete
MSETENLNTYSVQYRTVPASGTPSISVNKLKIQAKSREEAIDKLRSIVAEGGIRIDRIEQTNLSKIQPEKNKKSIFVWIFFIMLGVGSFAKLVRNLLN